MAGLRNVNITFVVTGYDEENRDSVTLYAGFDEDAADVAAKESTYCDFYKEVWHQGKQVKIYMKSAPDDDWVVWHDGVKKLVKEANETASILVGQLDKLHYLKPLLDPLEILELESDLKRMTDYVKSIEYTMGGINE
ncbi:hypothetical protein D307_gp093 [Bacillus phage Bastille]|uniref:Uncharacterized protein n=1 Tax=Bacillus phage Bastille TaxID=57477 RepID=J9PMB0_9CAUD|nr:hypothetical protein D307_gp093 [Bacillus phage Bastille]AEQ34371.1 hypothetical protein [Bacillus phage Bastille]